MPTRRSAGGLDPSYALTVESVGGQPVVRARCTDPGSHLQVTLTFPLQAGEGLSRFKQRLIEITLTSQAPTHQGHTKPKGRQGTA